MNRSRRGEEGFVMLFVFMLAAAIAITLYREIPRLAMEAQRSKEELFIKRGEQYKRAIQLFVRKNKRYPMRIEELEKLNEVRYLRKKFVDPMTGKDEWRLIHAGPGGVLLDSNVKKPPQPGQDGKQAENAPGAAGGSGMITGGAMGTSPQPGMVGFMAVPGQAQGQPGMPGQPGQPGQAPPALGRRASDRPAVGAANFPGGIVQNPYGSYGVGQYAPSPAGQYGQAAGQYGQAAGQYGQPPSQYPGYGQAGQQPNPYAQYGQPGQPPPVGYSPMPPGQQPQPGQPGLQVGVPGQQQFPGQPQYPGQQPIPGMQQMPGVQPGQPGYQPPIAFPPNVQPGQPYQPYPGGGMPTGAGQPVVQIQGGQAQPFGPGGPNPAVNAIMQQLTQPRPGGLAGPAAGGPQGQIMGGGIVGVGTTVDAEGVKVYNERTNYKEWEFVYDPKMDRPKGMAAGSLGGPLPGGNLPGTATDAGKSMQTGTLGR